MKIAIAIIVSLLLTNHSSGQNKFKALRWFDEINLSIGPSITSLNGQQNSSTRRTKIGFVGSAGLLHAFSSKLSLNFKLIFESKGSKNEDFAATQNRSDPSILIKGTIINKIKPTYISFAPLLRYHIGSTKLFIEGGPYISYLLSAVWDIETSFSDPAYNYHTFFNMQNDNAFAELDYGASMSIGYKIPFGDKRGITVQVMDNIGLADIINKSYSQTTIETRAISFLIGFNLMK